MRNSELIQKLQQFPSDMEVCLVDYKLNERESDGDTSSSGIYPSFNINIEDCVGEINHFISIEFKNNDIN